MHEYDEEEDDSSNGGGDGKKKDIESGTDDEGFEDTGGVAKTETEAVESEEETVEEANTEEMEQEMELKDRSTDDRQSQVVDLDDLIRDYDFDTEKSLYCRLTLSVSCCLTLHFRSLRKVMFLFSDSSEIEES